MAKDNQVLVRLNDPQFEAFKEFAEDRDYNHAEASREIIKSRLAGEGYLQSQHYDSPVTDGGQIVERLDQTDNRIEETNGRVQQLAEQIENQKETQSRYDMLHTLLLVVGVLYIAIELLFTLPDLITFLGVPIAVALVYSLIKTAR